MTSFRMTDNDQYLVRQVLKDMEKFQPVGQHILNRTNIIEVKPALMFDSVYALAEGLHSLQQGMDLRPANVSCEEEVPWTDGSSLFNYINSVRIGLIISDQECFDGNDGYLPTESNTMCQLSDVISNN
ncbi:glutamate receptor ionotropic, kainate 1 [Caerostris extrusa]|uniref:Glutamate receptor ionotropic, kainate 1 n=1 Tax=Caerostris extrusa TaxID=172846 RepID=A0AAV4R8Q9_CAEEX|nr:glutamate receptor ionotropic, kainate 1 [Caerostris extrusa]